MKKLISIIIPTFNPNQMYLTDLMNSIGMQQFNDFELLIVDDGSSNGIIEKVVNQYRDNLPQIKILKNTRKKGVAGAINTGILAANSHYIIHSGDDDLYVPGTFLFVESDLAEILPCDNIAGGYVGLINIPSHFSLQEVINNYSKLIRYNNYYPKIDFLTIRNGPSFASHQVFLKSSIAKIALYDEEITYGGDHEFWLRLLRNGYEFTYLNRHGAIYRQRQKSLSHANLLEGLLSRLEADDALQNKIQDKHIMRDSPFVYKNPAEYYQNLLLKIQKIANWAGYASAMKNESEYNQIISLIPQDDLKFIKPHTIRKAVTSGFIRYFSIEHTEQSAELMVNDKIIAHEIEKVTLDFTKKILFN
jgi:glycosyltransferase involved in cell wall biosynthesis